MNISERSYGLIHVVGSMFESIEKQAGMRKPLYLLLSLARWRGDYGAKKQLWFPSNYVEEIDESQGNQQALGAMQQDSIMLRGVTVGEFTMVFLLSFSV